MKTKLLFTIALVLGLSYSHWAQPSAAQAPLEHQYPYVEVVVTQEKIWLMPDEMPVANLPVRIVDSKDVQVLKKNFCSETEDWSLDVTDLPSGKYRILIGDRQVEYLEKQGRKGVL
jgi:hypothetical protein